LIQLIMKFFLVDFDDFQIDQVMLELMSFFHYLLLYHLVDTKVILH
jgi:hypothetical protein